MNERQREQHRAYQATWFAKHPEKQKVNNAKCYTKHREERLAYTANYQRAHPELVNARAKNYQHRKRAGGGSFSRASWEYLKSLFGHCCAYCKRHMKRLEQDHVIPISKGGWHFSGNIVPACRSCNSRKGVTLL
jgi:5-methylcytosine-specific restriction endonuclease McrA